MWKGEADMSCQRLIFIWNRWECGSVGVWCSVKEREKSLWWL